MHEETVVEPRTVPEIPKAASDTIVGAFVRAQQAQAALQACVELVRATLDLDESERIEIVEGRATVVRVE